MNWRIRLTWWDKTLLVIMAVAAVIAFVRFATGIGTVANINNAYPWGWWVGYGIMTMIAIGGSRLHDDGVSRDLRCPSLPLFRAPRRAHGFSLLRRRDYDAHGGAWPAVDGLDGPCFLGAYLRVVRSWLVRVSLSHRTRSGVCAGSARAGWLGPHAAQSCARFTFRSCSSA